MSSPDRVILPGHLAPVNYNLHILPVFAAPFVFTATTTITFDYHKDLDSTSRSNKSIVLHAKELQFVSAEVSTSDGKSFQTTDFTLDEAATTVTINFAESFLPSSNSQVVLKVEYSGTHNNQMAGFYRSQTTSKYFPTMISTQFEALDARRCFPCVDEPNAKATFDCSLSFPSDLENLDKLTVLGNTSVLKDETSGNYRTISFVTTPKMSTYLLAFCVGEFDAVSASTPVGKVKVSVYTPPGRANQGTFALDCAVRCLDLYDALFGQPFPLPKMDMIAISEFAAGAMENWGLVTYREVDVLIDEKTASSQQKQRVATVVAHELAHQWFGNLVTMDWWDDLWLNEGFASWMQNHAIDALFPEWQMWDQFITEAQATALALDALQSSHPIQVPIKHAQEVEEVFDAISYSKGANVVRMAHAVLGHEFFVNGLRVYMEKHQYKNAQTNDLWNAWETVSGIPVTKIMNSWTSQMGFPVLKVEVASSDESTTTLTLTQSWFLADGSEPASSGSKLWSVPLIVMTDKKKDPSKAEIMDQQKQTMTVESVLGAGFIKLNAGQFIPMRVMYDDRLLAGLVVAASKGQLPAADRAGLVQDCFALAKAGLAPASQVFQLLVSLRHETEYVVWEAIGTAASGLGKVLKSDTELYEKFRLKMKELVLPAAAAVGWEEKETDGHLGKMKRNLMIALLAAYAYDDPATITEARRKFDAYVADPKGADLSADVRTAVFRMVLKTSESTKEYEALRSLIPQFHDIAVLKHIYLTLGFVKDPKAKLETLEWATSGALKLQDFFYPVAGVGWSGPGTLGLDVAWQFFKDNFARLKDMVKTASPSLFAALVTYSASGFSSNEKADEIEEFFQQNEANVKRKVAQIVEATRTAAKFREAVLSEEKFISMLG